MIQYFLIILGFSLFILPANTIADNEFIDINTIHSTKIENSIYILEDLKSAYAFHEIPEKEFQLNTKPLSLGFSNSTWWIKFTLFNPNNTQKNVILVQDYPLIDYLSLWKQENNTLIEIKTGDLRPFNTREIDNKDFMFNLAVEANSHATFYLRYKTSGATNISLMLYKPEILMGTIAKHNLTYGIYFGGFLVLIIYNLFLFLAVRDKTFLYYMLYVSSYGLYMSIHNGLAFQVLLPELPWLTNKLLLILLSLSLFGALKFSRTILDTHLNFLRLNKIIFGLELILLAILIACPFVSYHLAILPLAFLTIVSVCLMLFIGIKSLLIAHNAAKYYMVAWSTLFIGVLIYMLKSFGLLPHNTFTHNAFQIGSFIEMILLSLALSSKVNTLKQETRFDPLTTLYNRQFFDSEIANHFKTSEENNLELSLLVIDIDYFKLYNDNYGRSEGDNAIRFVGKVLNNKIRKPAQAYRYGGEEFVVILPETHQEKASILAERIRQAVQDIHGLKEEITISIGISTYRNNNFDDYMNLFNGADLALYTAKREGRNRIHCYDKESEPATV